MRCWVIAAVELAHLEQTTIPLLQRPYEHLTEKVLHKVYMWPAEKKFAFYQTSFYDFFVI